MAKQLLFFHKWVVIEKNNVEQRDIYFPHLNSFIWIHCYCCIKSSNSCLEFSLFPRMLDVIHNSNSRSFPYVFSIL
ncbi:Uncharacterised protein [Legionella cherrii]|uniref:Uncharacterized protein n=1 Tax=Legionella cherrii TaxID=28084 RepID=A0ABY6T240_9GAMM|nr:Uncharacterised protein [Legionella cherrii]